eukprot:CAMPEP_0177785334 /NCGR_PEP_ID=MMETSP0491_2-20121128/20250_1 /TAXON_ID=63592 /ORGANISM="Tetraselmis chuii, Strain PLY429" /LENGTH=122 /DNA_ID=CAMNT_0019306303 /DNA_START=34 /DNA_END=403 /DNA_ORIENTATION=+
MSSKRRRSTSVQQVNHELLAQIVAPSSIAAAAGSGPARPVRKLSHTDLTPGVELFQEVHSPQGADAVRKFYNAIPRDARGGFPGQAELHSADTALTAYLWRLPSSPSADTFSDGRGMSAPSF